MENVYAVPVAAAAESDRAEFLQQVGTRTLFGLMVAAVAGVGSTLTISAVPALQNSYVALGIMLGSLFASQAIGSSLVLSPVPSTRVGGFVLGTALQGVAMGYLLLAAVWASLELYADPFVMIAQALGLVGLTVLGLVAYLASGPKNLSMIAGAMSALSLPMFALMVGTFLFPINGTIGIIVSVLFVGVSAAGLLYHLNQVMHVMNTSMVWPAAYHIALGVLVLFWNVLSLLLRLSRRR